MSVRSFHPDYSSKLDMWRLMRDCWLGEDQIKSKGREYLPATPGQIEDGMESGQVGRENYDSYRLRARYHDFVTQAIQGLIGIMHHKPPKIELPEIMEPLRKNATVRGETLEVLLRRINTEQLITGRLGVLVDIEDGTGPNQLPHLSLYVAEDITNWDDGSVGRPTEQNLNLVVLNESENRRVNIFEWEHHDRYRVLFLGDPQTNEASGQGTYMQAVLEGDDESFDESQAFAPSIANQTLDKIPFQFMNSTDIVADPDNPPLLGLGNLSLTVYRAEADYRQTLFMMSQDTLVIIGDAIEDEVRAGAGAVITVPVGGNAKYVGVTGAGLVEQRKAIENDKEQAEQLGGQLLDTKGGDAESGDALRIRVSARTASLNQIALAGAEGLQAILRAVAEWLGANPDEVVVEANRDFADDEIDGQSLVSIMQAKIMGAPISSRSIHRKLADKDLTEMTFEEELAEIASEEPALVGGEGVDDEEVIEPDDD